VPCLRLPLPALSCAPLLLRPLLPALPPARQPCAAAPLHLAAAVAALEAACLQALLRAAAKVRASADAGATYDGCFIDRGNVLGNFGPEALFTPAQTAVINAGHDALLTGLVAQLASAGKLALLNNNGNFSFAPAVRMIEDFAATEGCIGALQELAGRGLRVEAHAGYFADGSDAACARPPINSLAAFLIGAGEGAYYACAPGWTTDPRWPAVADPWLDSLPQYRRALGAPLGNASRSARGMWTRRFASGTNVSFNAETGNGRIAWGDGAVDPDLPQRGLALPAAEADDLVRRRRRPDLGAATNGCPVRRIRHLA
jgi:hypothetical protein